MVKNVLIVVGGIAGLFLVYAFLVPQLQNPNQRLPDATACTMDAKMCPDGSYVGRIAPRCEFAPCPNVTPRADVNPIPRPIESEPVFCTADAKICPDGTGVGRVGPNCEFAPCPGE
ncbi:hypothetical protein K2X83_01520 [Patescibacteria group bacterium]|nr:hypothetical protein [Patescibacteria group bacterium]